MSWKVVITGSTMQSMAKEMSVRFARYLQEEGAKLSSAEFQAEKPEDSLDCLHADAEKLVQPLDSGIAYDAKASPAEMSPAEEPTEEPTEENTKPSGLKSEAALKIEAESQPEATAPVAAEVVAAVADPVN